MQQVNKDIEYLVDEYELLGDMECSLCGEEISLNDMYVEHSKNVKCIKVTCNECTNDIELMYINDNLEKINGHIKYVTGIIIDLRNILIKESNKAKISYYKNKYKDEQDETLYKEKYGEYLLDDYELDIKTMLLHDRMLERLIKETGHYKYNDIRKVLKDINKYKK